MDNKETAELCKPMSEIRSALFNTDKPEFIFLPLVWSGKSTINGRRAEVMVRRYDTDVFGWTVIVNDGFFNDLFSDGGTGATLEDALCESVERAEYFLKNY